MVGHRRRRRDAGVTALEFVGVALVAGVVIAAIFAALNPDFIRATTATAVCRIFGLGECGAAGGSTEGAGEKTPFERATWGSAWFGGDSFASGEGIFSYDPNTDVTNKDNTKNECHRSGSSYQAQVFATAQSKGAFAGQQYTTQACSGAIVDDLSQNNHNGNEGEGPQMYQTPQPPDTTDPFDNIPQDASLITLSMGGNDIGFAEVVKGCVTEGLMGGGCEDSDTLRNGMNQVYGTADSPGTLEQQLAKVKKEHPDARIILVGYPPLFAEQGHMKKGPITTMSLEEQKWANQMARELNASGKAMADRLGIEWLDPTPAYVGPGYDHRAGSSDPYINGLVGWGDSESFHPNQKGHDATAGLLWELVQNGPR